MSNYLPDRDKLRVAYLLGVIAGLAEVLNDEGTTTTTALRVAVDELTTVLLPPSTDPRD